MKKLITSVSVILILILGSTFLFKNQIQKFFFSPRNANVEVGLTTNQITQKDEKEPEKQKPKVEVIAKNLQIPWEIVFLPDGDMLVTERPGTLLKIGKNKQVIQKIEGVEHVGEGGLMGLALHPNFIKNGWIYLYLTSKTESGLINRLERYRLKDNKLFEKQVILEGIAGARFHDGGRIEFGPDGYLYITTGDAGNKRSAQNTSSLNGKILRIKDDGSIPSNNPFNNAIYSYGHRNPQGLAWDNKYRLWITEHGPSGFESGFDELNLVEIGKNYGWPEIQGDEKRVGMLTPVIQSGADDTWAPAGMVFWKGSFFFAGLRGETLYQAKVTGENNITLTAHFRKEFGRIRAVVLGPDDNLFITTSNTDGRGTRKEGDDKIIRIDPTIFN